MAQLKSTNVTGNLSVTGNIIASQIIKLDGTQDQLLKADGDVQSLKAITDSISNNTTAITNLKGEKSGGGLPDTSNASTITVANALKRANEAYALADTKATIDDVKDQNYATKNELASTKTAILGAENYGQTVKTAYEKAAAANTAVSNLQGTGSADNSGDASTLTVVNALSRANQALAEAQNKTTMSAVESKNYATKTDAQGYADAVRGKTTDDSSKNTVYGAKAAATAAHTLADNAVDAIEAIKKDAEITTFKGVEDKIDGINLILKNVVTDEELDAYATNNDLAAAKTAILGTNDDNTDYNGTVKGAYGAAATAKTIADNALPKAGGNVTGHIYLTGASESSSTSNTSQLIFGTAADNHVALSSNRHTLVINPSRTSTEGQIVLYLEKQSIFPKGITTAEQISSTVTGKAPFTVKSNTVVTNLNANLLEGKHASDFGTSSQITDLTNNKLSLSGGTMTGALSFKKTNTEDTALANVTDEINNIVIANDGTDILTLKRITPDNFISKLGIAKVYNFKGAKNNLGELRAVTSAAVGDVYNVGTDNYACIKTVTSEITITEANFNTYWKEIGTAISLEGYATKAYVDDGITALNNTLLGDTTTKDTIKCAQYTADTVTNVFNTFKGSSTTTLANIDDALREINETTIPGLSNRIDGLNDTYATDTELSNARTALSNDIAGKVSKNGDTMSGNLRLYNKALAFTTVVDGGDNTIKARMEYNDTSKSIYF